MVYQSATFKMRIFIFPMIFIYTATVSDSKPQAGFPDQLATTPTCPLNMSIKPCPQCDAKCFQGNNINCTGVCVSGCGCELGYVRHQLTRECVGPSDCAPMYIN